MRKIKAWKSGWVAGAWLLALFFAGPVAAGGHDVDPVFFFVSDELVLNEETIDELCMAEGESGAWYLTLKLKPAAGKRLATQMASHIGGWFVLVTRDKVIFRSRIVEPFSGKLPLILVSRKSRGELEDLAGQTFEFAAPRICAEEEIPYP